MLGRLLDLQLSEEQAGSPGYLSASQLASSSRLVALYAELYSHTRAQTLNSLHTLPELVSAQVRVGEQMNYKDIEPAEIDLLTDFEALCLTDFIDWRSIHSWLVFSTQLVNCCPHGRRDYTVYCYSSTFSLTSPLPSQTKWIVQNIQTMWLWDCVVYHILQEFYTLLLTRFRTYKIASPPPTKMTSKDDV